jgi:hypothetical protein
VIEGGVCHRWITAAVTGQTETLNGSTCILCQ